VSKSYMGGGRSLLVSTAEVGGRPVVLYVDVPAGASTSVIDLSQLKLQQ